MPAAPGSDGQMANQVAEVAIRARIMPIGVLAAQCIDGFGDGS